MRPRPLTIRRYVERNVQQRLEIILQRVQMAGKGEAMGSEEASASDALFEWIGLYPIRHVPTDHYPHTASGPPLP